MGCGWEDYLCETDCVAFEVFQYNCLFNAPGTGRFRMVLKLIFSLPRIPSLSSDSQEESWRKIQNMPAPYGVRHL